MLTSRPAESGRAVPITVLVADDKEVVLSSIRLLLGTDLEIRIVGEAASFQQTLQRATELKPHIVLMDLHMPDESCISPQEIKSQLDRLGSRLIAMSFWNDQGTQALAESLGAVTLLDKLTLFTELIPAIKTATSEQPCASV
jgi:two-component system response regulator DevR